MQAANQSYSHHDEEIHESFNRINEEEILKKIGRINKLN